MFLKNIVINSFRRWSTVYQKKHIYFEYQNAPEFVCEECDVDNLASSNNIIRFKANNRVYYFKECRLHTSVKEYINTVLYDYFDYVCTYKEKNTILEYILSDIQYKNNFKKLLRINDYVEQNYSTIKNKYNGWNTGCVGLPSLSAEYKNGNKAVVEFMNEFGHLFIGYIRNEIYAYQLNDYVKNLGYQVFRASLNIATKKLADKLGLSELIPTCWYIKLRIAGRPEKFGIVTEQCGGICPLDLPDEEKKSITPEFQRQLLNLNVFDALCFQRDHKEENYFVTRNSMGKVNGVLAFDNDSPMTFFPFPSINFITSVKCSSIVANGKFNRPFADKELVESIINITPKELKKTVAGELSAIQRWVLGIRLSQLKKLLSNANIIERDKWDDKTLKKETDGSFGKTYLKHYLECDENALIQSIMGF